MTDQALANWHPDPFGRHEQRYWDGSRWTEHVFTRGLQGVDAAIPSPPQQAARTEVSTPPAKVEKVSKKAQRDVLKSGVLVGAQAGGGTLLTEPVLVVSQKAKLMEINAEYEVYDQHGHPIGKVREIGQNIMKKALGADTYSTRRLQILDATGQIVLTLTQPSTVLKSKVIVRDSAGVEVGQIVQKNLAVFSNIRFNMVAGGQVLGSINGEGWEFWNFNIQDAQGTEIARVTKTWAGIAKEFFTKFDNYVLEIPRPLDDPLRSLVVATALALDTTLRQGRNSVAPIRLW